jgi:imidazolonepropionase-like amidohydrolase
MFRLLILALTLSALFVPLHAAQTLPSTTVLANIGIIDATGAPLRRDMNIIVSDGRIQAISKRLPDDLLNEESVRIVDMSGHFAIPGLWNNHTHLTDLLPDPKQTLDNEPLLPAAIRAGRNAMDALRAGFTTLRVVGERDYIDIAWRDAFAAGVFVGPRIYASGQPITHSSSSDWLSEPVKGAEQMRAAVQRRVEAGVDLIKLIGDKLSEQEIEAGIDEAHRHGLPITVHAGGATARLAAKLGADGIEHGNYLDDETLELLVARDVTLDPTIVCNLSHEFIEEREQIIAEAGYIASADVVAGRTMVAYADKRSPAHAASVRDTLQRAQAHGVRIISGSDSNPIYEIGILEIEQLVFSGLSPMQAIQAATINSAQMMGQEEHLGTLERGKLADIVVLERNPLASISNLRSKAFVMKGGEFVNLSVDEGVQSFWKLYFLGD